MASVAWEEQGKAKSQINKTVQGVNKVSVIIILREPTMSPIVAHGLWSGNK